MMINCPSIAIIWLTWVLGNNSSWGDFKLSFSSRLTSPLWLAERMILAPSKLVETQTVRQQTTPYGASNYSCCSKTKHMKKKYFLELHTSLDTSPRYVSARSHSSTSTDCRRQPSLGILNNNDRPRYVCFSTIWCGYMELEGAEIFRMIMSQSAHCCSYLALSLSNYVELKFIPSIIKDTGIEWINKIYTILSFFIISFESVCRL